MDTNSNIWWREYRKRIDKARARNMSFEMILRRITKITLKEYVMNSSLSCIRNIFEPNICYKHRSIQIAIFFAMFGSIFYFLQYVWYENMANPLIVTMKSTTYPISNIEFPAVTLCNFNRISKKALRKYVRLHYKEIALHNESMEEVEWFYKQLGRLVDYSYNKSVQVHPILASFEKHLGDTHNIVELMKELSPPCEEMLLRCGWSGNVVDCKNIFSVRRTAHGHCCSFNHLQNYYSTGRLDDSIEKIKRQHDPGSKQGLCVVMDAMTEDYSYTLYNMLGFEVFILDPTHFADPTGSRVLQRTAQPDHAVFIELHSTKQIATDEVRKYPPETRKCLFRDEMKNIFNDLYSFSSCIIKCRKRTIRSLCKCTPYFFYMSRNERPICTLDDLRCLNKYREKLFYIYPITADNTDGLEAETQNALYCDECLPDCELTQHFAKHYKIPLSLAINRNKEFSRIFVNGLNMTGKTLMCVYQGASVGILNRLDIVFYWFEIISSIGGFCGVLIGFSIIGILEFVYFVVFRFYYNMYNFYNNKN